MHPTVRHTLILPGSPRLPRQPIPSNPLFAFQTKRDFTMMGGVLLCALIGLIMFGFLAVFFPGPFAEKVYAFCGALLFSAFLVYDIQVRAATHLHLHTAALLPCCLHPHPPIFASLPPPGIGRP